VFHDAEDCADSVAALAELIGDLDLVITTDTLAAHLAGAQGTPAWVMLQHAADWRWMHARDESPWYPSLRLFRQPKAGDWAAVMAAMAQALRGLRAAGSRRLVA
jgi:ADP-heptose:LPS heptosyltransferase